MSSTETTARFMGRSRSHAKTPFLRLVAGEFVVIVKRNARTSIVRPVVTTQGKPTSVFSHTFVVKNSELVTW